MVCFIVDERSAVSGKNYYAETRTDRPWARSSAYARSVGFIFIAEITTVHQVTRLFIGRIILGVAVCHSGAKKAAREAAHLATSMGKRPYTIGHSKLRGKICREISTFSIIENLKDTHNFCERFKRTPNFLPYAYATRTDRFPSRITRVFALEFSLFQSITCQVNTNNDNLSMSRVFGTAFSAALVS